MFRKMMTRSAASLRVRPEETFRPVRLGGRRGSGRRSSVQINDGVCETVINY
jgi:hypothetical protein